MNLKNKQWSYSSIKLYESCPYAFYQKYIEDKEESPNAMAQHGKFVHEILESYFKKEKAAFELIFDFEADYPKRVTAQFPFFNMFKSFYSNTYDYLLNFEGIPDKYEVISVEEKIEGLVSKGLDFPTKGYWTIGFIDLILKDENGIIIVDHKSHGKWASKKERKEYFRQLYIYSYLLHQQMGMKPYKLVFNKFRTNEWDEELFKDSDYKEAINWFCSSIACALNETDWNCKINQFYCDNLCGFTDCAWNGRK